MTPTTLTIIYFGCIGLFTAGLMYLADRSSDNWP